MTILKISKENLVIPYHEYKKKLNLNSFISFKNENKRKEESEIYKHHDFSVNSGSLNAENTKNLISFAKKNHWKKAIKTFYHNDQDMIKRTFSNNRINWINYLDLDLGKNLKVLEIGCGLGAVSYQLSQHFKVTSIDISNKNCEFCNLMAYQDNLNIDVIHSELDNLPLESNQYDLVCFIGSFEWMPYYFYNENPNEFINKLTKEVNRVLKIGGKVFIGSENSHFIGYFSGIREAHTNIPYISLVDWNDANELSQEIRNSDFRELTFNYQTIRNLFEKNGFVSKEFLWLYPDYSTPAYILPLMDTNDSMIDFFLKQRINPWDFSGEREYIYKFFRGLNKNLLKYFIEHYGYIAEKN